MDVTLNDDVGAVVEKFAKQKGLDANAAADRLIEVAVSRLNALKRYAKNQKKAANAEAPAAPAPVKAEKKAPVKRKAKKEPEVVVEEAAAEE